MVDVLTDYQPSKLDLSVRRIWNQCRDLPALVSLAMQAGVNQDLVLLGLLRVAQANKAEEGLNAEDRALATEVLSAIDTFLRGQEVDWRWEQAAFAAQDSPRPYLRVLGGIARTADYQRKNQPSDAYRFNLMGLADVILQETTRDDFAVLAFMHTIPWWLFAALLNARGVDLGEPLWFSVIADYMPRKDDPKFDLYLDSAVDYKAEIERLAAEMARQQQVLIARNLDGEKTPNPFMGFVKG